MLNYFPVQLPHKRENCGPSNRPTGSLRVPSKAGHPSGGAHSLLWWLAPIWCKNCTSGVTREVNSTRPHPLVWPTPIF